MSSTARGPRIGGAEDFYRTPSWSVRRRLDIGDLPGGLWLEPAAGDGAIIRAVNAVRKDVQWIAIDLRESCRAALEATGAIVGIGDFLSAVPYGGKGKDIVVSMSNTPYSLAQDFLERQREVAPNAAIVNLLRTNFAASEERAEFMRTNAPDIAQLPNRPSFYLRLTDSIEYSWMTFRLGRRRVGTFQVLDSTPVKERQRDMPPTGICPGPCLGSGMLDAATGAPLPKRKKGGKKRPPGTVDCPRCFGFGKIETGLPESMLEKLAA